MNKLYVRCQTKDYILDIVAARAGMRINKVNSVKADFAFPGKFKTIVPARFLTSTEVIASHSLTSFLNNKQQSFKTGT